MRTLILSTCMLLGLCSLPVLAQEGSDRPAGRSLEATAGNDALQVYYLSASTFSQPRSNLDYGLLLSSDRDFVGSASWMFRTNLNLVNRLRFRIGPKAYLAKLAQGNSGTFAVALGGDLRYELIRRLGIAVYGRAAYAPHVLMFGTPTNLSDFTAGVQVRFAPRLYALAGYRWLNFRYPGTPDDRVDDSVFLGMNWALL